MTTVAPNALSLPVRLVVWVFHMALPLLGLWLLVAHPNLDVHWEHHASHFVLTFTAALIGFVLGSRMNWEAARREDAAVPGVTRVLDQRGILRAARAVDA